MIGWEVFKIGLLNSNFGEVQVGYINLRGLKTNIYWWIGKTQIALWTCVNMVWNYRNKVGHGSGPKEQHHKHKIMLKAKVQEKLNTMDVGALENSFTMTQSWKHPCGTKQNGFKL